MGCELTEEAKAQQGVWSCSRRPALGQETACPPLCPPLSPDSDDVSFRLSASLQMCYRAHRFLSAGLRQVSLCALRLVSGSPVART